MEPRLNIKIADLFDGPSPVDVDFIMPGKQMPNDYMDADSLDYDQNEQAYKEQQQGLAQRFDKNDAIVEHTDKVNEFKNPAQQTAPYGQLVMQSKGFSRQQTREDFTMGVIASSTAATLVGSRVYTETPSVKIAGTVVAVGDAEFAVIWDDRTASVERKNDYELVVQN